MKSFKRLFLIALACICVCSSFSFAGCGEDNIVESYEYIEKENDGYRIEFKTKDGYNYEDLYYIAILSPYTYEWYECEQNDLKSLLHSERFIDDSTRIFLKLDYNKERDVYNTGTRFSLDQPQIEILICDYNKDVTNYIGYIKVNRGD